MATAHICQFESGQYITRTADYGLGIKHGLRYKTRTKHYGLGIKYGLRAVDRLSFFT